MTFANNTDIFLFVATIVVGVVGALLSIALGYLINTLRHWNHLVRRVHHGVETASDVVEMAREKLTGPSALLASLATAIFKGIKMAEKSKAKKKKAQEEEDEG